MYVCIYSSVLLCYLISLSLYFAVGCTKCKDFRLKGRLRQTDVSLYIALCSTDTVCIEILSNIRLLRVYIQSISRVEIEH